MSGGVDSSVAAAMLIQAGYQVEGIMLQLWSEPPSDDVSSTSNQCCTPDQMIIAKQVAERLGIPFKTIDVAELFKSTVVEYFIDTYSKGCTPNPCIICNKFIRFGFFLDKVLSDGFDYLASGHYARIVENGSGFRLLRGSDLTKDQSYVLYTLNQTQLSHLLFPLGGYTKTEIRAIARKFNLPSASQPESQDICFLADGDYRRFLKQVAPDVMQPGPISGMDGKIIGRHDGLPGYTIGQRKGLGISAAEPLYVQHIDAQHNALIVGPKNAVTRKKFLVENIHWIAGRPPSYDPTFKVLVKIRYRSRLVEAEITQHSHHQVVVELANSLTDITPGQSAVFYDGDICLGGGVISHQETSR